MSISTKTLFLLFLFSVEKLRILNGPESFLYNSSRLLLFSSFGALLHVKNIETTIESSNQAFKAKLILSSFKYLVLVSGFINALKNNPLLNQKSHKFTQLFNDFLDA